MSPITRKSLLIEIKPENIYNNYTVYARLPISFKVA